MKFIRELKGGLKLLSIIKDPTNTQNIFDLILHFQNNPTNIEIIENFEEMFLANPSINKMYQDQYFADTELRNPELYKDYADGTLGKLYYQHMIKYKLDYKIFPNLKQNRPMDYITGRVYWSHDIWHALLGYDSELKGEMEVQAFSLAQMSSPLSAILVSAGLINISKTNTLYLRDYYEDCMKAYERGLNSPLLLAIKLEEKMLQTPAQILDEASKLETHVDLISREHLSH